MTWILIALAGGVMLALAIVMSVVLGWASEAWRVEENPKVEKVHEALAGIDCGACGWPNCHEYAVAVVEEGAEIDRCAPGGPETTAAVAQIMGVEADEAHRTYAVVHCGATRDERLGRAPYEGEPTCAAANLLSGVQGCDFGCLGLSDCERACPFDAIHVIDGLAVVDYEKCTACGKCVTACPRDIITIEPFKAERVPVVACSNLDPGKLVRQVCKCGCIACKLCEKNSDYFTVVDNLSVFDYDGYEPGKHLEEVSTACGKCPTKCLPFRGKPEGAEAEPPEPREPLEEQVPT